MTFYLDTQGEGSMIDRDNLFRSKWYIICFLIVIGSITPKSGELYVIIDVIYKMLSA